MVIINILWDFDGTLFDTYPEFVEAFVHLSQKDLDRNEVLKWMKVNTKAAFEHFGISYDREKEYQLLYSKYSKMYSKPYPDVESVLAATENNIIVTHRNRESTAYLLEKYGLDQYITDIIAVQEDGFVRKPDTSSYEYVMKKYHLDFVVGDRDLDLIPAKKLNIPTIAFQNDTIEADYHVDSFRELLHVLQQTVGFGQ